MKLFCLLRRALVPPISCMMTIGSLFFSISLDAVAQTPAATIAPVITTIAGDGTIGGGGDGGPATSAQLSLPFQIALDSVGNLYVADALNNRIRKISVTGIISTIAGTGTAGFSGDGGPAASAELNFPTAVTLDASGNVYISEGDNHRVRKVDTSGIITTVAGNGTAGSSGDGGLATDASINNPVGLKVDAAGNLIVADQVSNRIRKIDTSGIISTIAGIGTRGFSGDGSPATDAQLNFPNGVTIDAAGNIYIADTINNRIRKIDTSGIISTIAGNGATGFDGDGGPAINAALNRPYEVKVDAVGNIYVADSDNNRIRKINSTGIISTIVGNGTAGFSGDGGPAIMAEISSPIGAEVDMTGNIYVADTFNSRIRKVQPIPPFPATQVGQTSSPENIYLVINDPVTISSFTVPQSEGGTHEYAVGTVTGCASGSPLSAGTICTIPVTFSPAFSGVRGIPLVVTTTGAGEFNFGLTGVGTAPQIALLPGIIQTVAGNGSSGFSGDNGPATAASMTTPAGVARDSAGNLYIATDDNRIRKVAPGGTITTVAGNGTTCASPTTPCGDGGPAIDATFISAVNLAVDSAGNLFISDTDGLRVRKVDANGTITAVAGNGTLCAPTTPCGDGGPATSASLNGPFGIVVDGNGNLFIADQTAFRIRKVTPNGIITTIAGTGVAGFSGDNGPAINATLTHPLCLAIDAAGNLYITDAGNQRVRRVDAVTGVISSVAGGGTSAIPDDGAPATSVLLSFPYGIAIDASGSFYVSDFGSHTIDKVDAATGTIRRIAGISGSAGFSGDGGPATLAQLNQPTSIALDSFGNAYIADFTNNRIRQVSAAASPASFPDTVVGQTSATQAVTISNIGNSDLSISGLTATSDFLVDSSGTCSGLASLAAGANCNLALDFHPQQTGARTGNVTITSDALNVPGSTQQVALSGNGLPVTTATALVLSTADTIALGTPVILTADVTPYTAGSVTASGTISFYDGAALLGSATISATGKASLTVPSGTIPGFSQGTHTLTAIYAGDANFHTSTSSPVTLTVNPAPIAVSLVSSQNPTAYGQLVTFTASVPSGATGTIQFRDGTANRGGAVLVTAGVAAYANSDLMQGTHPITASYSGDSSHPAATSDVLFQLITPPILTVMANNITRTFNQPNGTLGYTITGFIGSDTQASSVTGAPTLSTAATAASPVGSYPIAIGQGTLASSSYTFMFVNGSLAVTRATPGTEGIMPVTVTSSINPSSRTESVTFTATLPANATGQVTFMDGTVVLGTATILHETASISTSQLSIATHPITAVYGGDTNYTGATSAVLSQVVNKTTLQVIANDAQRIYGQPNPAFTATIIGFVNGDTSAVISGTPGFTTTATQSSPVGTYSITPTQGTLSAANYTFAFVNGTMTVNKSTLTVTANNVARVLGLPNPPLTTTITGFVNGDTAAVVSGAAAVSTTATSASPVGTYPIMVTQGTLFATNYGFTFVNGILLVEVVVLTPPAGPSEEGTPVTLTATVPFGATGTVTFDDGTTVLGTVTIPSTTRGTEGITVTLVVSTLAPGTHAITAVFSGDAHFPPSTSPPVTLVVTPPPADFTVASSTGRQLVPPGASANFTVAVSSMNAPFTDPVTMSATNLPPGATYTFSPAAVTPGAAGASTTFTVSVPPQSSMASRGRRLGPVAFALLLLPFACLKRYRRRPERLLLWILMALVSFGAVSGCGGGGYFSQTEQTYTITVTGTSGSAVRSTTVTLTVE
jgi:sugar lactone lactonase YvrE